MSMIGNPIVSTDFPVDYKSGNGSATAFTLSVAPASVNSIDVQISGVSQSPQTYSVSGTTLTFSAAPPTGTNNIVVRHLGIAGIPNVPAAGSVQTAQLGNITNIASSTSLTLQTGSTPTTAITVDASQNVGIGTTNPSAQGKLVVKSSGTTSTSGLAVQASANDSFLALTNDGSVFNIQATYNSTGSYQPIAFGTGGGERMRIDSSGNVGIGYTIPNSKLMVSESANPAQTAYFENTNTSTFTQRVASFNASRNTTNGTYKFISCSISNVAEKFYVFDSGSVYNSTGTYGTISDIKLKENIVDATPKLDKILQLQVRNFNFKTVPNDKQIGFVAQEIEQIFPSLVQTSDDKDEEGNELGTTTKQVKTSVLIPILVKAIQELNAKVEAQALEIKALKGTV